MARIDSGNTNASANSANNNNNGGGEYDKEPCPLCGKLVKTLPPHLERDCDKATGPTYE